jgi:hypothetical protein
LLLEFCQASGLRILNGRCGEDNNFGKYTCINTQGSSVIDYVLCRTDILSDHCCVHINLKSWKISENEDKTETDYSIKPYSYKWENSKKELYISNLCSNSVMNEFVNTCQNVDDAVSSHD